MRTRSLALGAALLAVLLGCDRQPPAGHATGAPAAAAHAAAVPSVAQQEQSAAAEATGQPSQLKRLNEDGSETVEEVSGDSGAHNPLLAAVASTVPTAAAAAAPVSSSGPTQWQDGVNYTRIVPAQPTEAPPGQIEVLEFFWYACPHCNALDPIVESWRKNKPAYVSFARVPVMWNEGHRELARLFYTVRELGKLDELSPLIFRQIHQQNDPLIGKDPNNAAEAERVQAAFVEQHGISAADFSKTYHSSAVDADLRKADELGQRYRVTSVPTFVVNGKYVTDVSQAGGPERLVTLINDLAAAEHKR